MPDITYSVKVSDEVQEQLKTLVTESGMNNKDFFINLLSIYEAQKAKEAAPLLTADIEELETLTRRINGVFVNVVERLVTMQKDNVERMKQAQENSTGTIELLSQRIKSLEQEHAEDEERILGFIEDKEQAETRAADLQDRVKSLEQAIEDKLTIIDGYKEKLDTQMGIVTEYKEASDENKQLRQENADSIRKIEDLERRMASLLEKADEQAARHATDMERLKDMLNIEHEKAMLAIRTESQRQSQEQNEIYNEKVKSLLERLEAQQAPPPKAPTKKATPNPQKT